ncbi:MAG: flagellar filament capping protein FliD [Lawsonibacter sp.]|jgi:flagellar hook-associated protein 2
MASISSLMGNSSSSSIYGSRNTNIISGLASGMDTESMIEGMVQGYQQKIIKLQQDRTKLQWQQEAYQSISDKLVEFSRNYMTFAYSKNNLISSSFFNNAVITSAQGTYADMVTATGKSSSNIVINAVAQLATAARANSQASDLAHVKVENGTISASGSAALDLKGSMQVSTLEGSMTLTYGTKEVTIEFGELEFLDEDKTGTGQVTPEQLKQAIEKKLGETTISTSSGDRVAANSLIDVSVGEDGTISFADKKGSNSVYISDASGKLKDTLGLGSVINQKGNSFQVSEQVYSESVQRAEYLSDKSIQVTLDGVTKTISLKDVLVQKDSTGKETLVTDLDTFQNNLNQKLDTLFGAGKLTVSNEGGVLKFSGKDGSTFSVQSSVDSALGLDGGVTSYLDTGKSLRELGDYDAERGILTFAGGQSITGKAKQTTVPGSGWTQQSDGTYVDAAGNRVDKDGYYLDSNGDRIYEFELQVNGKSLTFTQNSAMETVLNSINSADAGVTVSYSKLTNQFVFTATESGEGGQISIGGDLGNALFHQNWEETAGQDAVFQATINGETKNFTRSSNTFDLDGMSVTLNGLFNNVKTDKPIQSADVTSQGNGTWFTEGDDVTFTTKTDTDTLVDAIKQMVDDFNTLVTEVKKAYSDMPLQQSNGEKYEPLTSDDKADMTESEIKSYEEKAKTGILFMDQDLSSLYNALRNAVAPGGADGSYLRSIGIETSYEDGLTTINLNETALREALETDLEGVKNAFIKSKENGAATDGLMASIQKVTDRYAATIGETKGILIEKAGSKYVPTAAMENIIQDKMDDIDEEIASWQDKMSNKVDYYTNKFTQLEMLINQMNSQSSALAGLTGGY